MVESVKHFPYAWGMNEQAIEAEEIIGRFLDLFQRMQTNFEEVSTAFGLSPAEGHALHYLDTPAPMRAMANSLCCDASYITVLADRLESRGLIERTPDPDDRRVRLLALTEAGRDLRGQLVDKIHTTTPALTGLTPKQRQSLVELLRVLSND
jgi:DNA-binding MarR family transcriptional regulator